MHGEPRAATPKREASQDRRSQPFPHQPIGTPKVIASFGRNALHMGTPEQGVSTTDEDAYGSCSGADRVGDRLDWLSGK